MSQRIVNILKKKVSKKTWDHWFSTFEVKEVGEDVVVFSVGNLFIKDWLQTKYGGVISKAILEATGKQFPFEIVFKDTSEVKTVTKVEPKGSLIRKKPLMISNLNPEYTFDNFVVGKENKALYEVAKEVSSNPGRYNPFFIYGIPGLGKTHVLQSVAQLTMDLHPEKKVLYITSEQFMNGMIDAIKSNTMTQFREMYRRKADILLIDDIQFLIGKKGVQNEFFHTFNELHDAGKQLVICSDRDPIELNDFHNRLISRFQMGMVMEVHPPEANTRYQIAKKMAMQESVKLPDDVAKVLADNIDGNLRRLKGAIIKLIVQSSIYNEEIDLTLTDQILKSFHYAGGRLVPPPTPAEQLYKAIEGATGIAKAEINGTSRTKEIVLARQVFMYVLKQSYGRSVTEIANITDRKHSTVIHSIKKIEKSLLMRNESTRSFVNKIIEAVSAKSAVG